MADGAPADRVFSDRKEGSVEAKPEWRAPRLVEISIANDTGSFTAGPADGLTGIATV